MLATDWHPLNVGGRCVYDKPARDAHARAAIARGLPLVGQHPAHDLVAVLVGSGPSLAYQLDKLCYQRKKHRPIFALNGAHDWLIAHDLVPDYGMALDPRPHALQWFAKKQSTIKYLLASQCHPDTFDHLADCPVWLWHIMTEHAKDVYGPNGLMIGGGTTIGTKALCLLYTMGFRRFELYGYDSCLDRAGHLRVDGSVPDADNKLCLVKVGERQFLCNADMAQQAEKFQTVFDMMPDIVVHAYGDGLIAAILKERG